MSILRRHLIDLSLVRPHVRLLRSSAVVFRHDMIETSTTNVDHSTVAGEQVLFNDNTRVFAVKSTSDILRSLLVLKLCSYDVVARKSMVVRISTIRITPGVDPLNTSRLSSKQATTCLIFIYNNIRTQIIASLKILCDFLKKKPYSPS